MSVDALVRGKVVVGGGYAVADLPGTRGTRIAQAEESGGEIVAKIEAVPQQKTWLVERIVVQCTSTTATDVKIFAGEPAPANLVEASPGGGNLNIADEVQPIVVAPGVRLHVVWDNAPDAGSVGTVRIQHLEVSYATIQV